MSWPVGISIFVAAYQHRNIILIYNFIVHFIYNLIYIYIFIQRLGYAIHKSELLNTQYPLQTIILLNHQIKCNTFKIVIVIQ